ncbi:hypothetical protein PQ43W_32 [Ralstonia phage PQ43W]
MSRSGYTEDGEGTWDFIRWRGAVNSAINRGWALSSQPQPLERAMRESMPLLCLIVVAAVLLGGCDATATAEEGAMHASFLAVYADPATGCQYLRAEAWGGLTPRLRSDGRPMCDETKRIEK